MADIFISYARADRDKIETLAAALEAEGYSVWWDRHIAGGAEFSEAIEKELAAAKAVIVVWSAEAIKSRWVKDEAVAAADAGKLIPISIDGATAPMGFRQFHLIDLSAWKNDAAAAPFQDVSRAVKSRILGERQAAPAAPVTVKTSWTDKYLKPVPLAAMGVAVVALVGVLLWQVNRASPSFEARQTGRAPQGEGGEIGDVNTNPHPEVLGDSQASKDVRAAGASTLAVLPFRNLGEASTSGFTDGLHDDLLTQLSKIDALKVISRTSVMEYRGTSKNMRTIGKELNASHIMEGGIQRAGNRVRINVQLIDAATDEHVWAETYDRALTVEEIFNVQSDIARAITTAMRAELSPEEAADIAEAPTDDLVAYESYLQGRLIIKNGGAPVLHRLNAAVEHFQDAATRDPNFIEPWAALVESYSDLFWFHGDASGPAAAMRIIAHMERLVGQGHYLTERATGIYLYHGRRKLREAIPHLEAAIALRPNDARSNAYLGFIERRLGDFDTANTLLKASIQIDPMFMPAVGTLAQNYLWHEDWQAFDNHMKIRLLTGYGDELRAQFELARLYSMAAPDNNVMMRMMHENPTFNTGIVYPRRYWIFEGRAEKIYPIYDAMISNAEAEFSDMNDRGLTGAITRARLAKVLIASAIHARGLGDDSRFKAMVDRISALGWEDEPKTGGGEEPWKYYELNIMLFALRGDGVSALQVARDLEIALDTSEDRLAVAEIYSHLAQGMVLLKDVEAVARYVEKGARVSPAYNPIAAIMKLPDYDAIKDDPKIMALVQKYAPDFAAAETSFSKHIAPEYFYGPGTGAE